ncbi:MAG: hypothetical protein A2X22_12235 [Bacteroidetes bacterium GWF2_49_14]|nr:MAG: hypothetical protein A2X22_12235 [Bacteroidetes bacterium GWF2_49_14]
MKGVIFDLDGLLIDSEKLYRKVSYALAERLGKELTEEVREKQIGRSPLEANRVFREELGITSHTAVELMDLRNGMMLDEFRNHVEMMPGAHDMIRALHGRVKLAIATGSPRQLTDEVVKRLNIGRYFDHIQTSDNVLHGKPDPEIYLITLAALGLKPEECVVLEDSPAGAEAGVRAGCRVIAVPEAGVDNFPGVERVVGGLSEAQQVIRNWLG